MSIIKEQKDPKKIDTPSWRAKIWQILDWVIYAPCSCPSCSAAKIVDREEAKNAKD